VLGEAYSVILARGREGNEANWRKEEEGEEKRRKSPTAFSMGRGDRVGVSASSLWEQRSSVTAFSSNANNLISFSPSRRRR
jgi:hypothetical protein